MRRLAGSRVRHLWRELGRCRRYSRRGKACLAGGRAGQYLGRSYRIFVLLRPSLVAIGEGELARSPFLGSRGGGPGKERLCGWRGSAPICSHCGERGLEPNLAASIPVRPEPRCGLERMAFEFAQGRGKGDKQCSGNRKSTGSSCPRRLLLLAGLSLRNPVLDNCAPRDLLRTAEAGSFRSICNYQRSCLVERHTARINGLKRKLVRNRPWSGWR